MAERSLFDHCLTTGASALSEAAVAVPPFKKWYIGKSKRIVALHWRPSATPLEDITSRAAYSRDPLAPKTLIPRPSNYDEVALTRVNGDALAELHAQHRYARARVAAVWPLGNAAMYGIVPRAHEAAFLSPGEHTLAMRVGPEDTWVTMALVLPGILHRQLVVPDNVVSVGPVMPVAEFLADPDLGYMY